MRMCVQCSRSVCATAVRLCCALVFVASLLTPNMCLLQTVLIRATCTDRTGSKLCSVARRVISQSTFFRHWLSIRSKPKDSWAKVSMEDHALKSSMTCSGIEAFHSVQRIVGELRGSENVEILPTVATEDTPVEACLCNNKWLDNHGRFVTSCTLNSGTFVIFATVVSSVASHLVFSLTKHHEAFDNSCALESTIFPEAKVPTALGMRCFPMTKVRGPHNVLARF